MRSNRTRKASPPKRKRRALRRVKPRKGTLPFLLGLIALVIVLIIFAPGMSLTPAANISGTEVLSADVSTGDRALRISEAMSSNRTAFPDEAGSFPDWIELTNTGDHVIALKGYGLSDRADKITFIFPDISLAPGESIIVFASDENKNAAGHAPACRPHTAYGSHPRRSSSRSTPTQAAACAPAPVITTPRRKPFFSSRLFLRSICFRRAFYGHLYKLTDRN